MLSLHYLVVKAQRYFVTSSCMFLDEKTVHFHPSSCIIGIKLKKKKKHVRQVYRGLSTP